MIESCCVLGIREEEIVKRQLLKAMMFIAIACIATVLFLGLDREQSTAGSPIPEQKGASSSKPASGAMHDAQHNKIMLNMALEKNPGHSPVLLKLATPVSVINRSHSTRALDGRQTGT